MTATCPLCGEGHIVRDSWQKEFEHNGAILSAEHVQEYCEACGSLLQTPEIIRGNARNKQRSKNAHDDLLSGEEIRVFRETYGLTQKHAAQLFGGGPTAFAKYEADEIAHNVAMDRLLRLCMLEPQNIMLLAEQAKFQLPRTTVSKIDSVAHEKFGAMIAEAWAEMESCALPIQKEDPSANDNIFELFAGGPQPCPEVANLWALEAIAA